MKKSTLNFIIDLASFIILLGLVFTGSIIKWVLPPGSGGRGRELSGGMGGEHIRELANLSRHQWGDIHFWLAAGFTALMVVHIILHWSWIKGYCKSRFKKTTTDRD